jgi:hypothetical protein
MFCVAAMALTLSSAASATITYTPYWGWNILSRSNPSAGTCSGQGAAIACSGWNQTPPHDITKVAINSGDAVVSIGFENCEGCSLYGGQVGPGAGAYEFNFTAIKLIYPGLHSSYNRAYCAHYSDQNTYAYAKCSFGTLN